MIMEKTMPFLLRRGPDSFGEKQIQCSPSSNGCCFVHLVAVVLHLRGERIAKQPVEDRCGNILAWNGEIFDGLDVRYIPTFRICDYMVNLFINNLWKHHIESHPCYKLTWH